MNKENLLGIYETKQNHITLAFASLSLWIYPDTPRMYLNFYEQVMSNDERGISDMYPNVERLIGDTDSLLIAANEMYIDSLRSALTGLFSETISYCEKTGQLDKFKSQPWYWFWRILRNCLSHDMTFNFNKVEKSHLPVTWSGLTLDISMNGRPLQHGDIPYKKIGSLIQEVREFIEAEVT